MPGRRQSSDHAELRIKAFSSFEEIDKGVAKLRKRIGDVEAIDPRVVRYDHERVRDVEESIRQVSTEGDVERGRAIRPDTRA